MATCLLMTSFNCIHCTQSHSTPFHEVLTLFGSIFFHSLRRYHTISLQSCIFAGVSKAKHCFVISLQTPKSKCMSLAIRLSLDYKRNISNWPFNRIVLAREREKKTIVRKGNMFWTAVFHGNSNPFSIWPNFAAFHFIASEKKKTHVPLQETNIKIFCSQFFFSRYSSFYIQ